MMLACPPMDHPPRVLIVEDERIIAMATTVNLTRLGCDVVGTAPSGPEALEKVKAKRPDVVLMDIMLEGTMDGIETAHKIRETHPETPIIFCTAYTDDGTRARASAASPKAFMGKPLDYLELKTIIDELE